MTRRHYGQACSLADALDRIGERWSLLIVRELSLGPLRFSDLARLVGGAPTDVLTKRLRAFEDDGIVARRQLAPPASAVVYELTELGRGIERPMIELGRWGMNLQELSDVAELGASSLPNAMRVVLKSPGDVEMTVRMHSEGQAFWLQIAAGWIDAGRGETDVADVTLSGPPLRIIGALVLDEVPDDVTVEGSSEALAALRSMAAIPARLREEAQASLGAAAVA